MGIQRLASRLSTYSHPVVFDKSLEPGIAIVDGPGLVHYIYYRLCDKQKSPVGYDACAKETINWLTTLKSFGFTIEAIFFDGALPPSKKDIRIERLQAYISRVQAFKQTSAASLSSMTPELRKSLPPPPFLVFAVVEELLQSEFAALTHAVPGEADPYCVAAAKFCSHKGDETIVTIFSDDSDLLVYESGPRTRIVTLRDLAATGDMTKPSWSGLQYWPTQIAAKAPNSPDDLIKAAFLMSRDLHLSLDKAFRKVDPGVEDPEFAAFAESFSTVSETADWEKTKSSPKQRVSLASRDSRVSELVWQLQSLTKGVLQGGLRMYLPFLTDDPSRSTAWNIATDVRQLAYSILLQSFKCDTPIQEYRRSGTRVASVLVDRLLDDAILTELDDLSGHIVELFTWASESMQLDTCQAWTYLAIQHVLKYCISDNQSLPSLEDVMNVVTGRNVRKWHALHLSAQFQAAFYSFRILKQIVDFVFTTQSAKDVESPLRTLRLQLAGLPRISVFFAERPADSRKQDDDIWKGVLRDLLATLTGNEAAQESPQEEENRPRKKVKKSKKTKPGQNALAQNPFAMLAE